MKIEKTYPELVRFNKIAQMYIERTSTDQYGALPENKLCVAIRSIQKKQFPKISEEFNNYLDDARIDYCATDSNGVILRGEDNAYMFTKDGMRELKKKIREINEKPFTLDARIVEGIDELIAALTPEEKEVFNGIVIPAFDAE